MLALSFSRNRLATLPLPLFLLCDSLYYFVSYTRLAYQCVEEIAAFPTAISSTHSQYLPRYLRLQEVQLQLRTLIFDLIPVDLRGCFELRHFAHS